MPRIIGGVNYDPRFLRSQARLHAAILELAAEHRLDTITVTQLAQAAGVHRSTVYEHAESPEQLLRQAITAELENLYEKFNTIEIPGTTALDALFAILGYIETHERLYRHMANGSGAVIAEALSSHTAEILMNLTAKGHRQMPENPTTLDDELFFEICVRALTDSLVRVFSQWLELPAPRDLHLAAQLVSYVLPAWWNETAHTAS